MSSIPISTVGLELVKKEIETLKAERPGIIASIKAAREEGDLKENAGYDAARERQGMLEARITFLESRMSDFNVIDRTTLKTADKIIFGATVELENIDTEERKIYTLLGPDEANIDKGSISILSPVGRALIGKQEGDEVNVQAPKGNINYEIISIIFDPTKGC